MRPKAKIVTIKDVAERVGVSPSTVSYALSGKRSISPEVRSRISAAASELGYSASVLSQRLRMGRSHTLGFLYPWTASTSQILAMELLAAAAEVAQEAKYTLAIYTHQMSPKQAVELLDNQVVDGLLLAAVKPKDQRVEALRHTQYPFVLIGRTENLGGLASVDFDYERGCFEGLEYLAKQGHRVLGAIAPASQGEAGLTYVAHMQKGFMRARANLEIQLHQGVGGSQEQAYQSTLQLLELHPNISGLFTTHPSDYVGIVRALKERKRRIPQDCSVVAIATEQTGEISVPGLTAVNLPLKDIGHTAAQMLLRKLKGEPVNDKILRYAGLSIRESVRAV